MGSIPRPTGKTVIYRQRQDVSSRLDVRRLETVKLSSLKTSFGRRKLLSVAANSEHPRQNQADYTFRRVLLKRGGA